MQNELDFLHTFQPCHSSLLKLDRTGFLTAGFNTLMQQQLPQIIRSFGVMTALPLKSNKKFTLSIDKVRIYNTPLTLSDCFDYGLSLTLPVTARLRLEYNVMDQIGCAELVSSIRTPILNLPIPTGRALDIYDPIFDDPDIKNQSFFSGAFVCNGKMRSLPCVKNMCNSTILLIDKRKSKGFVVCQIRCANWDKPFRTTSTLNLKIHTTVKKSMAQGMIGVELPFAKSFIHVGVLAHALGCNPTSFVELVKSLAGDLYDPVVFRPYEISFLHDKSLQDAKTQELAMLMIAELFPKHSATTGINQVKTEVLSHINIDLEEKKEFEELHRKKLLYLAKCVGLVILVAADKIKDTSRDLFRFANIMTCAQYVGTLVRRCFMDHMRARQRHFRKTLNRLFQNQDNVQQLNLANLFQQEKLSHRILSAMSNGAFPPKSKGVTMSLNLSNRDGTLGQLSRIQSSLSTTDAVNTEPRHVQFDAYGQICPGYSPDGESVGLVMQWAIYATISPELEHPQILCELMELLLQPFLISISILNDKLIRQSEMSKDSNQFHTKICYEEIKPSYFTFFNNCGIFTHFVEASNVPKLIQQFRQLRRKGLLPSFCFLEILYDRHEIHISCCAGQICRLMAVLENIHLATPDMEFLQMLHKGIVEFINAAEEQTICFSVSSYKAWIESGKDPKITHLDLSQVSFLSPPLACVPYVTSQHGPRASHYSQQVSQTITAERKPPRGYAFHTELAYKCKSLTCNRIGLEIPEYTWGRYIPASVLILSGKEQEDAIGFSRASIERNFALAFSTRFYTSHAATTNNCNSKETFAKPNIPNLSRKNLNYDTVQNNGLPLLRTYVPGGGILLAKNRIDKQPNVTKTKTTISTRDISTTTRRDESGYVTYLTRNKTPTGEFVMCGITTMRPGELGDKFTTRTSGKGVMGEKQRLEDMAFSLETGTSPDMVIAALSCSARQVIATLFEMLRSKVVCLKGNLKYGIVPQIFDDNLNLLDEKELSGLLVECGFSRKCTETYMDGVTGQMMKRKLYRGFIDIARLVHIASKKLYARDFETGPRDPLTRQPCEGRMKGGGLRFGETESVATGSHGAAYIIEARFNVLSDPRIIFVCKRCKLLAQGNKEVQFAWCNVCKQRDHVCEVQVPNTFLVTITELFSMGIVIRIALEEDDFKTFEEHQSQWNDDVIFQWFQESFGSDPCTGGGSDGMGSNKGNSLHDTEGLLQLRSFNKEAIELVQRNVKRESSSMMVTWD